MLKKKSCENCEGKIKSSHNFCPSCGTRLKIEGNEWGMLGKKDGIKEKTPQLFSGIGGKMMNKMLGSAIKMLEKEMMQGSELGKMPKTKMKLMINGKEIGPQGIVQKKPAAKENLKFLPIDFSDTNLQKWKSLEKKDPKSNLKREGDKIKYEIEVPEVQSIKDVSIVKLENSLEVRAVGKNTSYLKRVPIDLPLKKYSLLKGILTLELDTL